LKGQSVRKNLFPVGIIHIGATASKGSDLNSDERMEFLTSKVQRKSSLQQNVLVCYKPNTGFNCSKMMSCKHVVGANLAHIGMNPA